MHSVQAAPVLTEAQSLNAILHLEGMPEELQLDVDRPEYSFLHDEVNTQVLDDEPLTHEDIAQALNLDPCTPVDTFITAQEPYEYRFKADRDEDTDNEAIAIAIRSKGAQ